MRLERLAPAKINLFLHVGPPAADGYHPVNSLIVFADIGDRVFLITGAGDGFDISGPFAGPLMASGDNLVTTARDRFRAIYRGGDRTVRLGLEKILPIAAGLGGGSADAAAALSLLAQAWDLTAPVDADDGVLGVMARELGADVAACLRGRSVIATGRGDVLRPAPDLPVLDAVLVNPGVPAPTGAVYRGLDDRGGWGNLDTPLEGAAAGRSPVDVARWLRATRNDLESPAIVLQPAIGEVLTALARAPETLMARMSGSGATCFALCAGAAEASSLAANLVSAHPDWWIRACRLGAPLQP